MGHMRGWGRWTERETEFMRLYKKYFDKPKDWHPQAWQSGNGNSSLVDWFKWLNQTHPPVSLGLLEDVFAAFSEGGCSEVRLGPTRREYEYRSRRKARPEQARRACGPGERPATEREKKDIIRAYFPEIERLWNGSVSANHA